MPVGVGPPPVAGRCWHPHGSERRAKDEKLPSSTGRANTAWQLTRCAALRAPLNATVRPIIWGIQDHSGIDCEIAT